MSTKEFIMGVLMLVFGMYCATLIYSCAKSQQDNDIRNASVSDCRAIIDAFRAKEWH